MPIILESLVAAFHWQHLLIIVSFTGMGIFFGAMPGLTATMSVALLIPITYPLEPVAALIALGAVYKGAVYGGCIPAILIRAPGTPASAATTLDGFPLTKKGEGGRALAYATFFSMIGGIVSTFALLTIAPPLARIALRFGPPENFWLAVFGLTIIGVMTAGNLLKGIISAILGLLIGTIGLDPMSGVLRFTFGVRALSAGIDVVPALIGLFSVSQAFILLEGKSKTISRGKVTKFSFRELIREIKMDFKNKFVNGLRSSIIGTVIGMIPGAGAVISGFISYDQAKRNSKNPEEFGKGSIDGVIAAETANNAVTASCLIPLLTLGIPGNVVSAAFLGGLMIHGLRPGPGLFIQEPFLIYTFIFGILLANIVFMIIGINFSNIFAKATKVSNNILAPMIIVLACIGSFAIRGIILDVYIALIFSILGFLLTKTDFSLAAIVLGLILGPIAERGLERSLLMTDNLFLYFINRPITVILMALTLISLVLPYLKIIRKSRS